MTKLYPIEEKYGLIIRQTEQRFLLPSNIAEGMGRNHKKDTIQFLHISERICI